MSAVSRNWLQRRADSLKNESLQWDLNCWADEFFTGLQPQGDTTIWTHVPITQMLHTDSYVAGDYIKPLAAQYIEFPKEMQDAKTDWLVADTLCFAEVNATLIHLGMMKGGKHANPLSMLVVKGLWSLIAWAVWLCIIAVGFYFSAWIGWTLVALTVWTQVIKIQASVRRSRLLDGMLGTYQALASSTFSWSVLWEHMADSRKLGAVWPPELYRLVELRMKQ